MDELAKVFLSEEDGLVPLDEKLLVAENMREYGGGFVKELGKAIMRADEHNTKKVKDAFPEYWEKFKNWKVEVK